MARWSLVLALVVLSVVNVPRVAVKVSGQPSTLTVPSASYPTIQSAVNAAASGDTIMVSAGIYRENVVVTKSLNITGASRATTTIDAKGNGPGVNITGTSSVWVQGFTINDTGYFDPSVLVNASSLVVISGNVLSASVQSDGVDIQGSSQISVTNCIVSHDYYGVRVQAGFGNLIQYNNVTGSSVGVGVVSSSGNKIADDSLRRNQVGLQFSKGSSGNTVTRDLITNNSAWGVSVLYSNGNLLFENSIGFNNADPLNSEGINIQSATGNRFYHNNIVRNSIQSYSVFPPGDQNIWDNTTGSALSADSKITFVDAKGSGHWDYNDTVVYDTDRNGVYDIGEPIIAISPGSAPLVPGMTMLKSFSGLKFVDRFGSGVWKRGDPVVNDTNNDNVFEAGEPAIAGVGGNYWSDYTGKDNGASGFALNGIGDTMIPWPCPNGGGTGTACPSGSPREDDWYPLMSVWVPPNMNVTATRSPVSGFPPLQVSFQARVAGGTAPYNYSWTFGDGTSGLGSSIVHLYAAKGSYVAIVSVSDSAFRTRSDSVGVSVVVGSLYMRVVDATKKPVVGANVTSTIQPSGQALLGGITNSSGAAFFDNLRNGTYSIQTTAKGFSTGSVNVIVVLGRLSNVTMTLKPFPPIDGFILWLPITGLVVGAVAVAGFVVWRMRRRKGLAVAPGLPSRALSRSI